MDSIRIFAMGAPPPPPQRTDGPFLARSTPEEGTPFPDSYASEPFRIFFPLGMTIGMIGVSLWPLYFMHVIATYPFVSHARLMIEGMMGAFIFGFLGTAGPRLTETRKFSGAEVGSLITLQILSSVLHLMSRPAWGDAMFLITLLFFTKTIGSRFRSRADLPPPHFTLVGLGLISGIIGAALLAWSEFSDSAALAYRLGDALLSQGFVLFPVLGAGVFLLRKFLGRADDGGAPAMRAPSPQWKAEALRFGGFGCVILASFVCEAFGMPRFAGIIRAAAIGAYLAISTPPLTRQRAFLANCLRFGLWSLPLASLWLAVLPNRPITGLHILFIGGFSVIVFTVATRVVFGHSGQEHRFEKRLPFFIVVLSLLLLALLSRIGADFVGGSRIDHLYWAAASWLVAAVIWGVRVLPYVLRTNARDNR